MYPQFFYLGEIPDDFIRDFKEFRPKFELLLKESNPFSMAENLGDGFLAVRYVMVIAEPWSGDVLYSLPPLLKIAKAAQWEVRIFRRDQYPDLILPYRKDGLYHSIPVFVFYDQDFNELAHWVERSSKATHTIDEESIKLRRRLREENKVEWQQETVAELLNLFHPHD